MWILLAAVAAVVYTWFTKGPIWEWKFGDWLLPGGLFIATALWWWFADSSGYSKRKAMEKEEQRKRDRMQRQRDSLQNNKRR